MAASAVALVGTGPGSGCVLLLATDDLPVLRVSVAVPVLITVSLLVMSVILDRLSLFPLTPAVSRGPDLFHRIGPP
jgi:hypothetical protein